MKSEMGVAASEHKKAPARTRKAATSAALDRAVSEAADEIRAAHTEELSDRATAQQVARLFLARLVPRGKPGAALSESVAIALSMRQKGENWQNIYPAALPGYRTMDKYERQALTANLRGNVRKALMRREPKPE